MPYITPVVLLTQQWGLNTGIDGSNGTRVYINAASSSGTPVELPVLGDIWSPSYPGLKVRDIAYSYAGDDPSCDVRKYVVSYSTASYPDEAELPTTIEMSANFQTYADTLDESVGTKHWIWPSDDVRATDIKNRKREITSTITVHKYVTAVNLNAYFALSSARTGKINIAATTINGIAVDTGCALYIGFSASQDNDSLGDNRWLVQLKFVVKNVTGVAGADGWNYIYRPSTNSYEKVTFGVGGNNVYETTTFAALL